MNNKIRLITVLIVSFFLVSLGMRNPYLSGGSTPKPHPRAVIENAAKNSLDVAQHLNIEVDSPHAFPYAVPDQPLTPLAPVVQFSFQPLTHSSSLAARASPLPSPLRS